MRRVYRAVAIPQLLYGVLAWYSPASRKIPAKQWARVEAKVTKIQRRAAILTGGASKSTAAAALDIELHLLPMRWLMQRMIEESALRIQTGPEIARPHGLRWQRDKGGIKQGGMTPLEALKWVKHAVLAPTQREEAWETRRAFVLAPWVPRIQCDIQSHEAALAKHDQLCREPNAAEMKGIEMALSLVKSTPAGGTLLRDSPGKTHFFTDSQTAIQAVGASGRPSGQLFVRAIYERFRALRGTNLDLMIQWIPTNIEVKGNEVADS